jgi:hypothetical protein
VESALVFGSAAFFDGEPDHLTEKCSCPARAERAAGETPPVTLAKSPAELQQIQCPEVDARRVFSDVIPVGM